MARILVADDELDLTEVFAELLRMEGHEVHTAADGVEALRQLEAWHPELAVLDVDMPKLSGPDVLAELGKEREGESLEPIPVVLLSGNANLDEVAASAGVDLRMTKPVDPGELIQVVAAALARHPARTAEKRRGGG